MSRPQNAETRKLQYIVLALIFFSSSRAPCYSFSVTPPDVMRNASENGHHMVELIPRRLPYEMRHDEGAVLRKKPILFIYEKSTKDDWQEISFFRPDFEWDVVSQLLITNDGRRVVLRRGFYAVSGEYTVLWFYDTAGTLLKTYTNADLLEDNESFSGIEIELDNDHNRLLLRETRSSADLKVRAIDLKTLEPTRVMFTDKELNQPIRLKCKILPTIPRKNKPFLVKIFAEHSHKLTALNLDYVGDSSPEVYCRPNKRKCYMENTVIETTSGRKRYRVWAEDIKGQVVNQNIIFDVVEGQIETEEEKRVKEVAIKNALPHDMKLEDYLDPTAAFDVDEEKWIVLVHKKEGLAKEFGDLKIELDKDGRALSVLAGNMCDIDFVK